MLFVLYHNDIISAPKGDAKKTLDSAIRDVNSKYHLLEETEKQALRRALIEERSRYCHFVNCLRPVVVSSLYINLILVAKIKYCIIHIFCIHLYHML